MTRYSSTLSSPNVFIPTATVYARHALATLGWSRETPGYWPHTIQVGILAGLLSASVTSYNDSVFGITEIDCMDRVDTLRAMETVLQSVIAQGVWYLAWLW